MQISMILSGQFVSETPVCQCANIPLKPMKVPALFVLLFNSFSEIFFQKRDIAVKPMLFPGFQKTFENWKLQGYGHGLCFFLFFLMASYFALNHI